MDEKTELPARTYTDAEARKLIARAIEIQRAGEAAPAQEVGTRLEDLLAAAKDLGVSPEALRAAAGELDSGGKAGALRFLLGAPHRIERDFPLAALPLDEALAQLAMRLSALTGLEGMGSSAGARLEWRTSPLSVSQNGLSVSVSIERGKESTRVRIKESAVGIAAGLFGGIGGGLGLGAGLGVGLGVGLGALGSPLFAALVPLACLGASWLLARGIFSLLSSWRRKRVDRVVEVVESALGGAGVD